MGACCDGNTKNIDKHKHARALHLQLAGVVLLQELRANLSRRFEQRADAKAAFNGLLAVGVVYLPLGGVHEDVVPVGAA